MANLIEIEGLIIKSVKFEESSRILTLLTRERGQIQVAADRVRTNRGGYMKGTQLFSFSWFSLFKNHKTLYRMNNAESREYFAELREDLVKLAYAAYFADVAYQISNENVADDGLLSLLLNTLHLLCKGNVAAEKLKAVYELRAMTVAGFMPDVSCRRICDTEINETLCAAIEYITKSEANKIFSFDMTGEMLNYLSSLSENYVAAMIEKRLKTLDYLKNII